MDFQDISNNAIIINDIDIEEELTSLQIEFDKIAIDKIPFDKVDIGVMFLAASVEILLDFLLSDPVALPRNAIVVIILLENGVTKCMRRLTIEETRLIFKEDLIALEVLSKMEVD